MDLLHEYIGWLGAFFFAICAIPQVVKTYETKQTGDLSFMFLLLWFLGEVFTFFYIIIDDMHIGITHFPLYTNYVFNIVLVIYLLYAKIYYKNQKLDENSN